MMIEDCSNYISWINRTFNLSHGDPIYDNIYDFCKVDWNTYSNMKKEDVLKNLEVSLLLPVKHDIKAKNLTFPSRANESDKYFIDWITRNSEYLVRKGAEEEIKILMKEREEAIALYTRELLTILSFANRVYTTKYNNEINTKLEYIKEIAKNYSNYKRKSKNTIKDYYKSLLSIEKHVEFPYKKPIEDWGIELHTETEAKIYHNEHTKIIKDIVEQSRFFLSIFDTMKKYSDNDLQNTKDQLIQSKEIHPNHEIILSSIDRILISRKELNDQLEKKFENFHKSCETCGVTIEGYWNSNQHSNKEMLSTDGCEECNNQPPQNYFGKPCKKCKRFYCYKKCKTCSKNKSIQKKSNKFKIENECEQKDKGNIPQAIQEDSNKENKYTRCVCGKIFLDIKRHQARNLCKVTNIINGFLNIKCCFCSKSFKRRNGIRNNHICRFKDIPDVIDKIRCIKCGKIPNPGLIHNCKETIKDKRNIDESKLRECTYCKKWVHKKSLNRHLLTCFNLRFYILCMTNKNSILLSKDHFNSIRGHLIASKIRLRLNSRNKYNLRHDHPLFKLRRKINKRSNKRSNTDFLKSKIFITSKDIDLCNNPNNLQFIKDTIKSTHPTKFKRRNPHRIHILKQDKITPTISNKKKKSILSKLFAELEESHREMQKKMEYKAQRYIEDSEKQFNDLKKQITDIVNVIISVYANKINCNPETLRIDYDPNTHTSTFQGFAQFFNNHHLIKKLKNETIQTLHAICIQRFVKSNSSNIKKKKKINEELKNLTKPKYVLSPERNQSNWLELTLLTGIDYSKHLKIISDLWKMKDNYQNPLDNKTTEKPLSYYEPAPDSMKRWINKDFKCSNDIIAYATDPTNNNKTENSWFNLYLSIANNYSDELFISNETQEEYNDLGKKRYRDQNLLMEDLEPEDTIIASCSIQHYNKSNEEKNNMYQKILYDSHRKKNPNKVKKDKINLRPELEEKLLRSTHKETTIISSNSTNTGSDKKKLFMIKK